MGELHLVTGGAGSGKSAYAEGIIETMAAALSVNCPSTKKIYLATMHRDESADFKERLRRHLALREGKNFVTWEQENSISALLPRITPHQVILLEDLSNLLANEMYGTGAVLSQAEPDDTALKAHIVAPILRMAEKSRGLVVVTNELFTDDIPKDPSTRLFVHNLARANTLLAAHSAAFTEVICGLPIKHRGHTSP